MLAVERRNRILESLKVNQAITVSELCILLEASEATIRRDLTLLETEGKLERTHGGALVNETRLNTEDLISQKETLLREEKAYIAHKAFETLVDGDSIILDGGTTTYELAKLIGKSNLKLTVISNSTIVFKELNMNPNLDLIIVGGKVRTNTLAAVGPIAQESFKRFNVEKVFLGANGVSIDAGLTTTDLDEAMIKSSMIQCAKTRILLADHSKFNKVYLNTFASLSMIDMIITDSQTDQVILKAIIDSYDLEVKR
ncbi:MAG: DeoR/GlpR transcriptional regulator [Erysipelotrichaceae bacterium]|nr:DeoR/GlpR transcriptional regulator [Erysipelotrichaceae bacterium]